MVGSLLNDMLIMASSKEEAPSNSNASLGFILKLDKSVLTPTQFLGVLPGFTYVPC